MGLYDNQRLDDIDPADALRIHLEDLTLLRAEMLPRYAATIGDGPMIQVDKGSPESCGSALARWSVRMMAKHGGSPTVKVWQTHLPWLAALLVVRYGEAPIKAVAGGTWLRMWPEEWQLIDVVRALDWESEHDIPPAVSGKGVLVPGRGRLVDATLTTVEG